MADFVSEMEALMAVGTAVGVNAGVAAMMKTRKSRLSSPHSDWSNWKEVRVLFGWTRPIRKEWYCMVVPDSY